MGTEEDREALEEANEEIKKLGEEVERLQDMLDDTIAEKDNLEERNTFLDEMLNEVFVLVDDTLKKYQAI